MPTKDLVKGRLCPGQQKEDLRQDNFKDEGPLCSHVRNKWQEEKPAGPAFSATQPIVTSPAGLARKGEAMAVVLPLSPAPAAKLRAMLLLLVLLLMSQARGAHLGMLTPCLPLSFPATARAALPGGTGQGGA